jgi:hypothetical protein
MSTRPDTGKIALVMTSLLLAQGCSSIRECSELPQEHTPSLAPQRLSETGLYMRAEVLAPGVRAYRPQFELWTDGAAKRRWIYLPPDTKIDTSDMDAWRFPEGTKLWKELSRDGVRVETRLLHKFGADDGDWVAVAYVWDREKGDAFATPNGAEDVNGTQHDVPAARQCMGCHGGRASRVLGFDAIQLAHAAPDDDASLERLVDEGRLTRAPAASPSVPGDATTRAALGYLHANCAHCHNQQRPASDVRCFDPRKNFDLSLRVDHLTTAQATPVYTTALDSVVVPGDPDASLMIRRFTHDSIFRPRMPRLGTEVTDPDGERILRAWIATLPRTGAPSGAASPARQ